MNIERIKITSTKGDLATVVNYPENHTRKLAILCSGFLDSKDYKHLSELADRLCEKGFTVYRFDSTGIWESEGDIANYNISQYLKDIENVLEFALQKGEFKYILLGGHSRGAQLSILYAAKDPRVSLVLGIMPSPGPIEGKRREEWEKLGIKTSQRDLPYNRSKETEFSVPFSHVLDKDQYDAFGDIKKINSLVVLVMGEFDELIPAEEVEELFENANKPKKFINIKVGHDYRLDNEEVDLVNNKILKEIEENL